MRPKVHYTHQAYGVRPKFVSGRKQEQILSGLVFDHPQANGKVQKDEDRVFDLVAQRARKYEFKYAKACGMPLGRMKGN